MLVSICSNCQSCLGSFVGSVTWRALFRELPDRLDGLEDLEVREVLDELLDRLHELDDLELLDELLDRLCEICGLDGCD